MRTHRLIFMLVFSSICFGMFRTIAHSESTPPTSVVLKFPGSNFQDTGITISAGECLIVSAYGICARDDSPSFLANPNNWAGPDGQVLSAGPINTSGASLALMGRIGSGKPFFIGTQQAISTSQSGRLYLGVNDSPTSDNVGLFMAVVTVCSGPCANPPQ